VRRRMARRLMGRTGGLSEVMRFAGVTTGMARGVWDLRLLSLWLLFTREVFGHFVSYRSGKSRLKISWLCMGQSACKPLSAIPIASGGKTMTLLQRRRWCAMIRSISSGSSLSTNIR